MLLVMSIQDYPYSLKLVLTRFDNEKPYLTLINKIDKPNYSPKRKFD